jgi:hypothetical protein
MDFEEVNKAFGGALGNPGYGTSLTDSVGIVTEFAFGGYDNGKYKLSKLTVRNAKLSTGQKPTLKR